ncbi:hypothetical protein HaLaN_14566 [Haematococcus lacustris]|uniref:Uncharacterized protein n=1 Tax=Haematococcus lacustris TaxID=44745 RepID=A0A699ZPN1_HAELA|nr:hypothetical protein HaLaN_14566 [Haematococcus lacustris]
MGDLQASLAGARQQQVALAGCPGCRNLQRGGGDLEEGRQERGQMGWTSRMGGCSRTAPLALGHQACDALH